MTGHRDNQETGTWRVKFIDMHSHWSTERGYVLRTPEELAQQIKTWRSEAKYRTEDEQAADLRAAGVKADPRLSFTKKLPIEETAELHDYAFAVQQKVSRLRARQLDSAAP